MCYSIFFREGNKIHRERSSVEEAKIEVSKNVFFVKILKEATNYMRKSQGNDSYASTLFLKVSLFQIFGI